MTLLGRFTGPSEKPSNHFLVGYHIHSRMYIGYATNFLKFREHYDLFMQPVGYVWSKVGNNDVCSCTPEASQYLQNNPLLLDPPFLTTPLAHTIPPTYFT